MCYFHFCAFICKHKLCPVDLDSALLHWSAVLSSVPVRERVSLLILTAAPTQKPTSTLAICLIQNRKFVVCYIIIKVT